MKNGFCNHKDKHCEIVSEWKCVDIRYPDNITPAERQIRNLECKKKDWIGVCELCRYFKPDEDQPKTGTLEKPAGKPTYTPEKKKEQSGAINGNGQSDQSWLEDIV